MMRLLADENFPRLAVEALRVAGHDVLWVRSEMAGADDERVLERARADGRVLVTFDKDYGEMAYHRGLPSACGVILFRFALTSPEAAAERVVAILADRDDWSGHFAVVEQARVRLRPLPNSGNECNRSA